MKLFNKTFKKTKTKNFIKETKLFFIFFYSCLNIQEWALFKKQLIIKNLKFLINSKVWIKKIFYNSIYTNFTALNNQISILVSFKNCFLLSKAALPSLPMLAIKLNKSIYHKNQLKNNYSFYYINNKLILFKFSLAHLKIKSK